MTEAPAKGPDASPELKSCLGYSLGLHLAAAAVGLGLLGGGARGPQAVYTIDFVGPSGGVTVAGGGGAPAAKAPAKAPAKDPALAPPSPQADFDEFGRRRRRGAALPRPSLLRGFHPAPRREPAADPRPADAVPGAEPGSAGGGTAGEAGVATDLPNFPYPWYITQVRTALWSQWSARMPRSGGECVVVFSIRPNGEVVDLRTQESSGDPAFDLAAMSAVQDSGPFPPLPRGFSEPFLKVHVTLKAGGPS